MPKQTPVQYAEQTLEVHAEQQQALKEHKQLVDALDERVRQSAAIRELREELEQREADLVDEQRADNPEMSATAFREHMKQALQQDDEMRDLRRRLREAQTQYEVVDLVVKQHETRIRIHTARMTELGGLLFFYGAAKMAAVPKASGESKESESETA